MSSGCEQLPATELQAHEACELSVSIKMSISSENHQMLPSSGCAGLVPQQHRAPRRLGPAWALPQAVAAAQLLQPRCQAGQPPQAPARQPRQAVLTCKQATCCFRNRFPETTSCWKAYYKLECQACSLRDNKQR